MSFGYGAFYSAVRLPLERLTHKEEELLWVSNPLSEATMA